MRRKRWARGAFDLGLKIARQPHTQASSVFMRRWLVLVCQKNRSFSQPTPRKDEHGRCQPVHLAGGSRKFGMMVDTHATDVWREVWELFDQVCRRIRPEAVIIERDSNFGLFSDTLAELDIARGILARRGLRKPLALTVAAA